MPPSPAAAIVAASPPRCLIVDDSQIVRKVARRLLEKHGIQVQEAGSGHEALHLCRQAMPTCVLLDWNMPGMSGIEFLADLCGSLAGEKPVVVFCTAEKDRVSVELATSLGADGYIPKPFDETTLIGKFRELGLNLPCEG